MYKNNFIFIGLVTVFFILSQPNLFVKIPVKYNMYFVLLHCLIFAVAFCFVQDISNNSCEGFTDQEKEILEKKRQMINKAFEKYNMDEIDNMSNDEIAAIVNPLISDLSEKEKERLKEYSDYMLKKSAASPTHDENNKSIKYMHNVELQKKMDYLGENASVEQIQFFDALPKNQQNALENILDSMSTEDIKKYLELDTEKLKKSLMEVLSLDFN